MKKNLLMLLLIIIQQSFVFAQIDKNFGRKNVHQQISKTYSSSRIQMDKLKPFPKMVQKSIDNETILSLPDTIIEYSINDTTRSIHTYDENGNFLSWTIQLYLNPIWENEERESFTYDDKGNAITYLYEVWDDNNWVGDYRAFTKYDEHGNETEGFSESWVGNFWEISYQSRTTNTYDDNKNLLSTEEMKIIEDTFVNARHYDYSYDSEGNMLTILSYKYGSEPWEYEEKTTYTYDSNKNVLTELSQYYSANAWSNGHLEKYKYNSDGSVAQRVYHNLDYNQEPYTVEYDTVKYDYDINGNLHSIDERDIYTYDSNGNLHTWDFYTWDSDANQWIKKWSEPCRIYIKTTYSGKIWNSPVEKFGNLISFMTYGQGNKMIFHWTSVTITGIHNKNENNKITIFPNPVNTVLNIIGNEYNTIVKIFSMDGKLLQINLVSIDNQILDMSHLKNGIYILKIETSKETVVKKFIKQ